MGTQCQFRSLSLKLMRLPRKLRAKMTITSLPRFGKKRNAKGCLQKRLMHFGSLGMFLTCPLDHATRRTHSAMPNTIVHSKILSPKERLR